ncbi:ABC transporter substrate-binding protein [Bifidobacterium tibiigranuli]|jgi:peptide/nickel transport system substrate-binding protein|uniref:ABC transporter substrate-binding protein n=1 Tax=Bifidobacterium tibiigranuli TaxID=2172043 RepID=UPI0026F09AB0|nr:ABC transporter substrate-binding protein [Bifidobacterium tibiigranuli]MCI1649464.1 ABC transporter substrate-binding protein [Bifidobacterium tibiigranuli]MCI1833680.1 ABC transporter substrate-binding protein [Bifidobacterium tibiigranuli]MCI2186174.1 ABC transporter substrate-binding protein [Bifidobacterium tibiigranuli]MCI2203999.1 ABC transporter substrate-binding protein [Bifidobacterium tibiigranuli]
MKATTMKTHHSIAAAITAAAITISLAACGGGGTDSQAATTDTIRSNFNADLTSFDPALTTALDDYTNAQLLYDTLVKRDNNNKFVGGLAKSWNVSPTHATFVLKDNLTCGDGSALTASMAAASLQRLVDPATKSGQATLIFGSRNVTVTGDDSTKSVDIKLGSPNSELLSGLSVPAAGIICKAGLDDPKGMAAGKVQGAFSGPYKLASVKSGVEYDYDLRDNFKAWPKYSTPLKGVPARHLKFVVSGDPTSNANQITSGTLDVALISAQDVSRFKSDGSTSVVKVNLGDTFIVFNERAGSPFTDQKLRVAVAQSVDAKQYNKVVNSDNGERLLSAGDSSVPCVNKDPKLLVPYNPKEAKGALNGVKIKLVGSLAVGGAEYVSQALTNAGAKVDLVNTDNATWASTVLGPDTGAWDMTVFGSINSIGTLTTGITRAIGTPITAGGRNMSNADNPEGLAAYSKALAATNETEMCAAYADAQKSVLGRVDVDPLVTSPRNYAVRKGFSLWAPSSRQDISTLRIVSASK